MPKHHDKNLLRFVTQALESMKAEAIITLPVSTLTTITHDMVIATGTSSIHVRSIADRVIEQAKKNKISILSIEGQEHANWILIDLGDVIVHVMQEASRQYYHLEKLWSLIEE